MLSKLVDFILNKLFKFEPMIGIDSLFLKENLYGAGCNTLGFWTTEKFEFDKMKTYIMDGIAGTIPGKQRTPRSKSKVIDMFGSSYWVQMTDKEWNLKKDAAFIQLENVHTMKEVEAKCAELLAYKIDMYDNVPYRYFFIPDYSKTESMIFYMINHAYMDGVSYFPIMQAMNVD